MIVMKFGGTSVGSGKRILEVGNLVAAVANPAQGEPKQVGLVVSAVTGVTNHLLAGIDGVLAGKPVAGFVDRFAEIHAGVAREVGAIVSAQALKQAEAEVATVTDEFRSLLTGVSLLRECSASVSDHISSLGERASAPFVAAALEARGLTVKRIDPRDFVVTDSVFGNASPQMPEIEKRFAPLKSDSSQVWLMPGFFGADPRGKITTLGRGGSDYSAAIMAAAVRAERLEIWTDVDGVYTADPRMVPDALVLEEMSYAEAMELSFFGAKVLHPRTIAPVVALDIPTLIKNTFNPTHPGTLIHAKPGEAKLPVRGVTTLGNVAMIGLSGAGLRGVPGVAARVFTAMAREGISVVLIAQSSSEYSICFCVDQGSSPLACSALEKEFALEIRAGLVNPLEAVPDLAIISVVGDQMRHRRGIAGTFFEGLAAADVNVVAIAQGFSERNISAVVTKGDAERAMRATHQFFFNTRQGIQVFLVGIGVVGAQLLEQIEQQTERLRSQQIDVKICAIANSRTMILDLKGIPASEWKSRLSSSEEKFDLYKITKMVQEARLMNPVFVDCTGSREIALSYLDLFQAGFHVVTPNKLANADRLDYYRELRRVANLRHRQFHYEATVGASLPVIETLKNMMKSGDRLRECRGILSGSMSFLMGRLEDGIPFSQALKEARDRGFTEPDPREDLSGRDVARKLLILAREAGFAREADDVTIKPLLPPDFSTDGTVDEFMARASQLDERIARRVADLQKQGMALRFVGSIIDGACTVGLAELPGNHPLARIREGENAVSFLTDRFQPIPLVVRGYGAGPAVTAAGVFADILRTVFWNLEVEDIPGTASKSAMAKDRAS